MVLIFVDIGRTLEGCETKMGQVAKIKSDAITKADLIKYLDSVSDSSFEAKVVTELVNRGFGYQPHGTWQSNRWLSLPVEVQEYSAHPHRGHGSIQALQQTASAILVLKVHGLSARPPLLKLHRSAT